MACERRTRSDPLLGTGEEGFLPLILADRAAQNFVDFHEVIS